MLRLLHCDDKTISEMEDELNYIPLTLLEKRILRHIVCGYSDSSIARELSSPILPTTFQLSLETLLYPLNRGEGYRKQYHS